jgi:hypothetical protein
LIISHGNAKAEKDCRGRIKAIEKLRRELTKSKHPKSLVNNYNYKKYLMVDGDIQLRFNGSIISNTTANEHYAIPSQNQFGCIKNIGNNEPKTECDSLQINHKDVILAVLKINFIQLYINILLKK